ncbi:MAG: hypothetical protein AAFU60_07230, partial [Bacteroidota bacterium]
IVTDLTDPNCGSVLELGPVECENAPCSIEEILFDVLEVSSNGYLAEIDIIGQGSNSSTVEVFLDGILLGTFAYSDFPALTDVPCLSTPNPILTVCDVDEPDCCQELEIDLPGCTDECILFEAAWTFGDCTPGGLVFAELDFDYSEVGMQGFMVEINGEIYGPFEYAELPISFDPFVGNGQTGLDILIYDVEIADCGLELTAEVPDCPESECIEFSDIPANTVYSIDQGSQAGDLAHQEADVDVYLADFIGSDGVPVFGTLIYDEVGTIFPGFMAGDGIIQYHGHISTVFDFTTIGTPVSAVSIDFAYEQGLNLSVNGYTLQITGDINSLEGMIAPGVNLEVFLDPNSSLLQGTLLFTGAIEKIQIGGTALGLDNICYELAGECTIGEVLVEAYDCDPATGTFAVDIDFEYEFTGGTFTVGGNGQVYGTYAYADLPITIEGLAGDAQTVYEFIIQDTDHPDCMNFGGVGPIDCGTNCLISDLVVETGPCNVGGTYSITLDFDYLNASNDFFDVIYQNEVIGFYLLSDLPVTISDFAGNGALVEELTICINDDPNCCSTVSFEAPDCGDGNVWPGDADANNIAQHYDLLNIGIAYGLEGEPRDFVSIDWNGFSADDWALEFLSGTNYKHADANGDGLVDLNDVDAILENYNETNGPVAPFVEVEGSEADPPFYADLPDADLIELG